MIKSNYAWAVRVKWKKCKGKPFFAGRYWFDSYGASSQQGCHVALFSTRAIASLYCSNHRDQDVALTPVKVRVEVTDELVGAKISPNS